MGCQGRKKAQVFLLTLGCEIAPDPPARIDDTGPCRLGQRVELHDPAPGNGRIPCRIIQIEQARRHGFVDRVHPPFLGHGQASRFVLICDAVPA